jgi:hypothetical protein
MSLARRARGELLAATFGGANEWLFSGVRSHVLFQGRLLIPPLSTTFVTAYERLLSSVDSIVN